MADLVWVQWYATVLRQDELAAEVALMAPIVLRYGASEFHVHVSNDDRYRITQMAWFNNKTDWYRYWDGPEMIEFRARNTGKFQIPTTYTWADEIASGTMGPPVRNGGDGGPDGVNGGNGSPSLPASPAGQRH